MKMFHFYYSKIYIIKVLYCINKNSGIVMVDYKDIKLALIKVIKVAYSQNIKQDDKMKVIYIGYLKILQHKRDPDDYCKYVAK